MQSMIRNYLSDSVELIKEVSNDSTIWKAIESAVNQIIISLKAGGKVFFCGNGGSAADAQHFAAELSGKFYFDRAPLNAEALHVNTSYLTAVANDYSFDEVYSRLVKAQGRTGDVLVGISTSGNSSNVVNAISVANSMGIATIGLTGRSGGKMKDISSLLIPVPSEDTPKIQECHIVIGHLICCLVEKGMFDVES